MSHYLFSYGTLQNEAVQIRLFGRTITGNDDTLTGYKISTIEIKDETFLEKGEESLQRTLVCTNNSADTVTGLALEVTDAELEIADSYEPENYICITVKLTSGKTAWVYVASEARG